MPRTVIKLVEIEILTNLTNIKTLILNNPSFELKLVISIQFTSIFGLTPSNPQSFSNVSDLKGFVSMSAICSLMSSNNMTPVIYPPDGVVHPSKISFGLNFEE